MNETRLADPAASADDARAAVEAACKLLGYTRGGGGSIRITGERPQCSSSSSRRMEGCSAAMRAGDALTTAGAYTLPADAEGDNPAAKQLCFNGKEWRQANWWTQLACCR